MFRNIDGEGDSLTARGVRNGRRAQARSDMAVSARVLVVDTIVLQRGDVAIGAADDGDEAIAALCVNGIRRTGCSDCDGGD
jgi:hypothetical protein